MAVRVGVGPEDGGVGLEAGIAGGVGHGGLGRIRVGNRGNGVIAGVVKSIVDSIEKGRWEQVVGPEVAYCNGPKARTEVTRDLGAYCNETKLHECKSLIDVTIHPSSTTATTNTTTTTISTTNDIKQQRQWSNRPLDPTTPTTTTTVNDVDDNNDNDGTPTLPSGAPNRNVTTTTTLTLTLVTTTTSTTTTTTTI